MARSSWCAKAALASAPACGRQPPDAGWPAPAGTSARARAGSAAAPTGSAKHRRPATTDRPKPRSMARAPVASARPRPQAPAAARNTPASSVASTQAVKPAERSADRGEAMARPALLVTGEPSASACSSSCRRPWRSAASEYPACRLRRRSRSSVHHRPARSPRWAAAKGARVCASRQVPGRRDRLRRRRGVCASSACNARGDCLRRFITTSAIASSASPPVAARGGAQQAHQAWPRRVVDAVQPFCRDHRHAQAFEQSARARRTAAGGRARDQRHWRAAGVERGATISATAVSASSLRVDLQCHGARR